MATSLAAGESVSSALQSLAGSRRPGTERLIDAAGLRGDRQRLHQVLCGIAGARSALTVAIDPLWTLPAHLAQSGPLTTGIPALVAGAVSSVTCSTFNFQRSSALWDGLAAAAARPQVRVRLYLDAGVATSPTPAEVAQHLAPAQVMRTMSYAGSPVVNHAKLLVLDSRFVVVTSANFSHAAAYKNVEFGVKIDNGALAESIERELSRLEGVLYERVV